MIYEVVKKINIIIHYTLPGKLLYKTQKICDNIICQIDLRKKIIL